MAVTLDNYELCCELLGHSMDVRAVATGINNNNEQLIFSGSRDKTVKIWKPLDNEYIESVTLQDHTNFVASIFFLSSEKWLCTGSNDATICIYKIDSYVPILKIKGHDSTVCCIAGGINPRSITSGSWDNTARVWTIDENGDYKSLVLRGHEAAVWSVAIDVNNKNYITGSADKCIYYWNLKGEKLRLLKGHTDCVRGLLILPSNFLVSCANDAIIRVWNTDGETVSELSGHTNYIYGIAEVDKNTIVTCGEDSTLRMWDLIKGVELGGPIVHPAQSVWAVTCLLNGDIVTACSDGIVRVYTRDSKRFASESIRKAYKLSVEARLKQMNEELGGIKKTDLPGPESLLLAGTREGQTKMVRHGDGSVKCYSWEQGTWNLIGDVTGATKENSNKTLYEGKEYDFVFSVDISDTMPPLKLPYNLGEDPWHVAQTFIHRNSLPQTYLDQVANFIIKNSTKNPVGVAPATNVGYQDPFTGSSRYVPGSRNNGNPNSGDNLDPFTGASSYTTNSQQKVNENVVKSKNTKHFPVDHYMTFDNCDANKVLLKLKEFNKNLAGIKKSVSDDLLEAFVKLGDIKPGEDTSILMGVPILLSWPTDYLFPIIDILRLAVRDEAVFKELNSSNFFRQLLSEINSSPANQLMVMRCLTNMMCHEAGRNAIDYRLSTIVELTTGIKSGTANMQIAIATFFLNVTIDQRVRRTVNECLFVPEGIIDFLKWAKDLEACYRLIQAIGNLIDTPHGPDTVRLLMYDAQAMNRLRELKNTPQSDVFIKVNTAANDLLDAFEQKGLMHLS